MEKPSAKKVNSSELIVNSEKTTNYKLQTNNFVKIGQASEILGVSIDTLRRWERLGKITVQRTPGGTRLYPLSVKIGDASKILGVSIDTLRRWEAAGKIATIRTSGGTRLYSLVSLSRKNKAEPKNTNSTEELLKKTNSDSKNISPSSYIIPTSTPITLEKTKDINKFLIGAGFTLVVILIISGFMVASFQKKNGLSTNYQPRFNRGQLPTTNSNVLAVTTVSKYLEINSDTQINGSLSVRDGINGLTLEATPSTNSIALTSGDTTLTVTKTAKLDQDVSTTSTPTFASLNLSSTKNQLVFQSGGPTGTLTWTPTGARIVTLPDATTTLVGKDTTDTLTNKSISGSTNTLTNIPNSALTNPSVTVTAGTNLTGGGTVALGGSVTLALKDSPAFTGQVLLTDGTAAAPALAFSSDIDSGLYLIGTNKIALITGGTATSGITIDASGNLGVANNAPAYKLDVTGTANITSNTTIGGTLGVTGASTLSSTLGVSSGLSVGSAYYSLSPPPNGAIIEGNVGIGTSAPGSFALNVNGDANITGSLITSQSLTFSSLSQGSVVFAGSSGTLSQNNPNFYWDDTNTRLGIGTSAPSDTLTVSGTSSFASTLTASNGLTLTTGALNLTSTSGAVNLGLTSSTQAFRLGAGFNFDSTNSRVGIGSTAAPTSALTVIGNIGIGTSAAGAALQVNGGGLFGWGTASSSLSSGAILGVNGNVGVGTTTPLANLHVVGQCVTGDTRLRRRKKKKNGEWSDEYEDIEIKDIQTGDQILSLNESTGEFEPHTVKALKNMGKQGVFMLVTQSGKRIETTNEHPYLTITHLEGVKAHLPGANQQKSSVFEVDQSPKVEILTQKSVVAIAQKNQAFTLTISKELKRKLFDNYYQDRPKLFGPEIFAFSIIDLLQKSNTSITRLEIDTDYTGYGIKITALIKRFYPEIDVRFKEVGKHSPAHLAAYLTQTGRKVQKTNKKETLANLKLKGFLASELLRQAFTRVRSPHGLLNISKYTTKWEKIKYLKPGMIIATADGWEKIQTKYSTGKKQTFDIEVSETHNFVGNNIVAHNTFITGNVGIANSAPSFTLDVVGTGRFSSALTASNSLTLSTGALNLTSTSGQANLALSSNTNAFTVNGLFGIDTQNNRVGIGTTAPVQTFQVNSGTSSMVVTSGGNVGIGFTSPTANLHVVGTTRFDGTTTSYGNILPGNDVTYDLGSSAVRWNNLYAYNITATNIAGVITGGSTSSSDWLINSTNTSDSANSSLSFKRGSATNAVLQWYGDNNTFDFNSGIRIGVNGGAASTIENTTGLVLSGFGNDITTGTNENLSLIPNGTGNVGIGTSNPTQFFQINSNGSSAFVVTSSGNVGIGTTTADYNLSVVGTANFTGNVGIGGTATISSLLQANGGLTVTGSSILQALSATDISSSTLTTTGNVGVGGSLTVTGTSTFTGLSTFNGGATIASGQNLTLSGFTSGAGLFAGTSGVVSQNPSNYYWDNTNNRLGIGTSAPSAAFQVNTNTSNPVVITSTGNVGIGTTSPAMLLQVMGNAGFGDSVTAARASRPLNLVGTNATMRVY
ncbi:MerR family DNA-binding transcriptional regulator, partial [Candidatus Daviesbacteria bacterium]|nr:MerR family DNA-binding transcriptional regulator [Candidatus Daviesbacteria bacterium]